MEVLGATNLDLFRQDESEDAHYHQFHEVSLLLTRSGPKIPAAGYLEDEIFLDLKNLSFGLLALKVEQCVLELIHNN